MMIEKTGKTILTTGHLSAIIGWMGIMALSTPALQAEEGAAQITYVDGGKKVYVDQGSAEGLTPGMTLQVQRKGKDVATLELTAVSRGRSAARIVDAHRPPKSGDVVLYHREPPTPEAPITERKEAPPNLDDHTRALAWRDALLREDRPLVTYESINIKHRSRMRARVDSQWVSTVYSRAPQLQRNEQRISLWSKGENLGVEGMSLRMRGDVQLRYGGGPYDYHTDQIAVIQLREIALNYDTPTGIYATAGRFKPQTRQGGLLDGVQLGWGQDRRLSVNAFGGLRPTLTDLHLRTDVSAYGVAATFSSVAQADRDWWVSAAYLGENGTSLRQSITLDSAIVSGDRWLREQATLRLPSAESSGGIGLLSLRGQTPVGGEMTFSASARYMDQTLPTEDLGPQTLPWQSALEGRALARADIGLTIPRTNKTQWRPYAYWHHQSLPGTPDVFVAAAGLAWKRPKTSPSDTSLDIRADYGDGTRQQARFSVTAKLPPRGALSPSVGWIDQWTFSHATALQTYQHIAHANLMYTGDRPVDLWVGSQAGFDHGRYPRKGAGVWASGHLGARVAW